MMAIAAAMVVAATVMTVVVGEVIARIAADAVVTAEVAVVPTDILDPGNATSLCQRKGALPVPLGIGRQHYVTD
jgi:hypothetical protein